MKLSHTRSTLLALGALASLTSGSFACPGGAHSAAHLLGDAELVFHGSVEAITYKMSEPGGLEGNRVPYTFITYHVDEVIRGNVQGNTVTLRFLGGFDPQRFEFMTVSSVPMFDVGDEDILFVQGNNHAHSPLVCNHGGRLRVIDGQIYTETGRSIEITEDNTLRYGPRYVLEDVATTHVEGGVLLLEKKFGPDALTGPSAAASTGQVLGRLRTLGRNLQELQPFRNADPLANVAAPDMTPAPPPARKAGEGIEVIDPELGKEIREQPRPQKSN